MSKKKKYPKATHLEYLFDYGIDLINRTITLSCDIDEEAFRQLDAGLTELENCSKEPIIIKINSFGGHVYEALAIIGRMKATECSIITEGYGAIMSAASLILAAGDTRKMSRYAWFMWHEVGDSVRGGLSKIKTDVRQLEKLEAQWAFCMQEFSNQNKDFWLECGKKDTYFTAYQCKDYGIIDEII